jgi:hypothetical protein
MMITQIAYHTADEVNLESAMQAAKECGASLSRSSDPIAARVGSPAAMLHDLDHVDAQRARAIVEELLSRPAPFPVAVHGYNLGDDEMRALHANGVIASRRFNPGLVRALCRASVCTPTAGTAPKDQDSQSMSEDPAVLCEMVRSLAARAFRSTRRSPDGARIAEKHQTRELRERIDQLQRHLDRFRQLHDLRLEALQRWLNSLRRCVEDVRVEPPCDSGE